MDPDINEIISYCQNLSFQELQSLTTKYQNILDICKKIEEERFREFHRFEDLPPEIQTEILKNVPVYKTQVLSKGTADLMSRDLQRMCLETDITKEEIDYIDIDESSFMKKIDLNNYIIITRDKEFNLIRNGNDLDIKLYRYRYNTRIDINYIFDPKTIYNIYVSRLSCFKQIPNYASKMTLKYYQELIDDPDESDFVIAFLGYLIPDGWLVMPDYRITRRLLERDNINIMKNRVLSYLNKVKDGNYEYPKY